VSLPQNLEAEQHVLGSILSNNACFDRVSSILSADDFFEPVHRHLYQTMSDMIGAGSVANPVTLKGAVSDDLRVGELSGMRYVVRLFAEFAMPYAIVDLATAVKDAAVRRELVLAAERIHEWASLTQPGTKTEDVVAECEKLFSEAIGKGRATDDGDAAAGAIEEISLAHQRQKSEAVPWFIGEAQQVLGDDLEFGWLVGLLADSGGGKTSFALQQAYHAMEAGYPVLFLSGDQKPTEVYKQIASQRASVQSNDLRKGRATRVAEDAEGIGFGKVAVQGTADNQVVDSEATAKFVGIAVADPGQPADIYAQYANVAVMKRGVIVVSASEAVAVGDPVYYTPASGALSKTATSNTLIAGATWDTSTAGAGLAALRLNTP
jgi:replicative DNA helicase